ncbi:MAG TPA: hypothetical protein VIJ12_08650 [Candidatus Baltobacteraceae bacterium]
MKLRFSIICLVSMFAAFVLTSSTGFAAGSESHIYTNNKSDSWVWITVYQDTSGGPQWGGYSSNEKNIGAWCVAPGQFDKHGVHADIYSVRAEVTYSGCSHPVRADLRQSFDRHYYVGVYTLTGSNGHYEFKGVRCSLYPFDLCK